MKCENPTCRSGRPGRVATPAFHPITATAMEFADLSYRPEPEIVRIVTCRVEPCMTWARLRAEDIEQPWREDEARAARRVCQLLPKHIEDARVLVNLSETIASVRRAIANRGAA